MSTLFHLLAAAYRLVVALCNACIVFLQVMQLVLQEAKQEAAEVVVLLGDGASLMVSPNQSSDDHLHQACLVDRRLLTGVDHVDVVAARRLWTRQGVGSIDYREGVVFCPPLPTI